MKELTMSAEDYLEAIYVLCKAGAPIKSTDVAAAMNVSKPAVNKAMNELIERGLVEKQPYGKITLSAEGRTLGEEIYARHLLIRSFLLKIGVSEKNADIDCCKLEHFVSRETLNKLDEFVKKS